MRVHQDDDQNLQSRTTTTYTYTISLLIIDVSIDIKLERVATVQVDINVSITLVELLLGKEQLEWLPAAARRGSDAAGLPEVHDGGQNVGRGRAWRRRNEQGEAVGQHVAAVVAAVVDARQMFGGGIRCLVGIGSVWN